LSRCFNHSNFILIIITIFIFHIFKNLKIIFIYSLSLWSILWTSAMALSNILLMFMIYEEICSSILIKSPLHLLRFWFNKRLIIIHVLNSLIIGVPSFFIIICMNLKCVIIFLILNVFLISIILIFISICKKLLPWIIRRDKSCFSSLIV
jgi:hypothetical protein